MALKKEGRLLNSLSFCTWCFAILLMLSLTSSVVFGATQNVTTCQNLTTAGDTYSLQNDISTTNMACIGILADNITFDCNGYTVTRDYYPPSAGYPVSAAIYAYYNNNTIVANCRVEQPKTYSGDPGEQHHLISLDTVVNFNLSNMTLGRASNHYTYGRALSVLNSRQVHVLNSTLNVTGLGYSIYISNTTDSTFDNLTLRTRFGYIVNSQRLNFSNVTFVAVPLWLYTSSALRFNNITFTDTASTSASLQIINSPGNTFENVSIINSVTNSTIELGGLVAANVSETFTNVTVNYLPVNYRYSITNQVLTDAGNSIALDICAGCSGVTYSVMNNTSAFLLAASTNSSIQNLQATAFARYISIYNGTQNTIANNNLYNTSIRAQYTTYVQVVSNNITTDTGKNAIYSSYTAQINFSKNTVNCLWSTGSNNGCVYDEVGKYNLLSGNNVTGSMYGFFNYASSNNNYTYNNVSVGNRVGFYSYDTSTNNVYNYNIITAATGISSSFGWGYTAIGNNITATSSGINPNSGGQSIFLYNNITLTSASAVGIDIIDTDNINLSHNSIATTPGISVYGYRCRVSCDNNYIFNTTINLSSSTSVGVWLESGTNNTVLFSNITASGTHVQIDSGSSNNTIYKNNLSGTGYWVNNSGTGSVFNTTVSGVAQGNYYAGIYLNVSAQVYDANFDGWADGYGAREPASATTFSSKWIGNGSDYAPATLTWGCGNITTSNYVYNLTQTLNSSSTCLYIYGNNNTINGNGFNITSTSIDNQRGVIEIVGVNNTLKNIKITSPLGTGGNPKNIRAYSSATNTLIENISTSITQNGHFAIYADSDNLIVRNSTIVGIVGCCSQSGAIIVTGQNSLIVDNNITGIFHSYGPIRVQNTNTTIARNIITRTSDAQSNVIYVTGSSGFISDNIISNNFGSSNIGQTINITSQTGSFIIENNTLESAQFVEGISIGITTQSIIIRNNTLKTGGSAILSYQSRNALITNNKINVTNYNSAGIAIFDTNGTNITLNTIFVNATNNSGILLVRAINTSIRFINFTSNASSGSALNLNSTQNTALQQLILLGNTTAVNIINYANNTVIDNILVNVTNASAIIYDQASDNLTINNSVIQSTVPGSGYTTIRVGENRLVGGKFVTTIENSAVYMVATTPSSSRAFSSAGGGLEAVTIDNSIITSVNATGITFGESTTSPHIIRRSNITISNSVSGSFGLNAEYGASNTIIDRNIFNILSQASGHNSITGIFFYYCSYNSTITDNNITVAGNNNFGIQFNNECAYSQSNPTLVRGNNITTTGNYSQVIVDALASGSTAYRTFIANNLSALGANSTVLNLTNTKRSFSNFTNNNLFVSQATSVAILMQDAPNTTLAWNNITTPSTTRNFAISGGDLVNQTPNISVTNLVNGLPITYGVRLTNFVFNGSTTLNSGDEIVCIYCNNVTFRGFNTTANVSIYSSNYSTIRDSTFTFTNSSTTVLLSSTLGQLFTNNNVSTTVDATLLMVRSASYLNVTQNRFNSTGTSNTRFTIYGDSNFGTISNGFIDGNTINSLNGSGVYYPYNAQVIITLSNNNITVGFTGVNSEHNYAGRKNVYNNYIFATTNLAFYMRGGQTYFENNTLISAGSNALQTNNADNIHVINTSFATYGVGRGGIRNEGDCYNCTFTNVSFYANNTGSVGFQIVSTSFINISNSTIYGGLALLNGPGIVNVSNTTYDNITIGGTSTSTVYVNNFVRVNLTNVLGQPLATTVSITNTTLGNVYNLTTGSNGLSNYTLVAQAVINTSGYYPTYANTQYSIRNATSTYYISSAGTINATTTLNAVAENPTVNLNYTYVDDSIPNYNFNQQYVRAKQINLTAYNSTALNLNITINEVDANNHFLNTSNYSTNCATIAYQQNCTVYINLTLNSGLAFNSPIIYYINFTNRNGTVTSQNFTADMIIAEYAQIGFNQTTINYTSSTLLNNTQTTSISVENTGSTSTAVMDISAINVSSAFTFLNIFDSAITQIAGSGSGVVPGSSVTIKVRFALSNYTAANYTGAIRFNSSKIDQTIPFIVNVTSYLNTSTATISVQHNTSKVYSLNYTNAGNVPLQTLTVAYEPDTLPSSWLSFTSTMNTTVQPYFGGVKNFTVTVPAHYAPGTYNGTLRFSATNGLNQSLEFAVIVPTNRSWYTANMSTSVNHTISDSVTTEQALPSIIVYNNGNVDLNLSVAPIYTGLGDRSFSPSNKFTAVGGQNPVANVLITKNASTTLGLALKSFLVTDLPLINMGLGINFTTTNTSDTTNTSQVYSYIITIVDNNPQVAGWSLGIPPVAVSNGQSVEMFKQQTVSVVASDDGNQLNLSSAYFTVANNINTTNYSVGGYTEGRFFFNFTPITNQSHNVTFTISENVSAGAKVGTSNLSFYVSPRPSSVIISSDANTVTTNQSNKTNDLTLTLPVTLRVNGNVSIYNTTIFIYSPYGWSASTLDYGNVTQNNTNLAINTTLVIPKGTLVGNYTTNVSINYTNPDRTNATASAAFTVQVLPNADFQISINDTLYQQHGTTVTYTVTLVPQGNYNTTISLTSTNTTYTTQYFNGTYATSTTGHTLLNTANTSVFMRIIVPAYSSVNSTFNISARTSLGNTINIPVSLIIPANSTLSASASSVNTSVVAGETFTNKNLVNISNTGNVPVTLGLSLNGTFSTLSGAGGSGATIVPSLTILPGNVGVVYFNYTTPSTSDIYTGTLFANASATLNVSVPISVSAYQFTLSAYNFTGFSSVRPGDTIHLVANLLDGSTFVNRNITFIPRIGGTACNSVSTQEINVSGDPNFIINCAIPTKADGQDFTFTLTVIYETGARGTVVVTSANTGTVSYADTTAPTITSASIVDFQAGAPTAIIISGTDNVAITDSNSNAYAVTLSATRTETGTTQTDTFNRILGSPGDFLGTVTYATPGAYTYYVTFTDAGSNSNSSYTGSFNVYQYKNYSSNLNYTNDSGSTLGVYANITLYNALNTSTVNVLNGTFNATLKTDTYTINITDRTSILSLVNVNLLDLPTNDIFRYGQLKTDEYRVLSQGLYSDLSPSSIYNGIFMRMNASVSFKLRYNYSSYAVSNENGIRAYACYNYSLGEDPFTACKSGFVELTRTTLSTAQDYVVFDSPIATTRNQTVAIIFFSYVLVGQPAVQFADSNITVLMNHNSTTSTTFSITSVSNAQQGGTLTGITFSCINSSSINDVCKNLTVSDFSLTSLSQGLTQPFTVTIRAPQGLAAGTYSGTMRYQSNTNSSTPLLHDIPIYVTILSASGYVYTSATTSTVAAGANGDILLDNITFTNTGNAAVPLTFTFNGTLLSDASTTVLPAQTSTYRLRIRAPSTLGIYRYGFTFGSTTLNYTLNVSQLVNITAVSPASSITSGATINVSFDLFENQTAASNIIQSNNAYFTTYSLEIENISCTSSIATAVFDNIGSDQFTCTAPAQSIDKNSYTLTLNVTRNGVTTSDTYPVSYLDQLAPAISNVSKLIAFANISHVNFSLVDRSNVSSSMTATIRNSNGTVATYSNLTSYNSSYTNAQGLFNTSQNQFVLQYNYSVADDFTANITYCDTYSNCNTYTHNVSHYPLTPFNATQTVGLNSSLISAAIQTSSGLWTTTPPVFTISFRKPGSLEEIASGVTDATTGTINITSLQARRYDVVANSTYIDISLSNTSYNGSQIIALEQVSVSGITNGKLGFNFEPQSNFTSALLTYRTASGGDLAAGRFLVCTEWNFAANTCTGTLSTVVPTNYTTSGSQFVYTLNVTHFSAYILVVPPISTTSSSSSSSSASSGSSGGGGGGGASLGQIESLLNSTVNNLSRITPSFRDEVRADTTRIEQNLYPGETARVNINLVNTGNDTRKVSVEVSPELTSILAVEPQNFEIPISGAKTVSVLMTAPDAITQTVFDGFIRINYVNEIISIPVKIRLLEAPRQPPSVATSIITPRLTPTGVLRFQIDVSYPYVRTVPATITYAIYLSDSDQLVYTDNEQLNLSRSINLNKAIPLEGKFKTGNYYIRTTVLFSEADGRLVPLIDSKPFTVTELFFFIQLFKIGNNVFLLWHLMVIMFIGLSGISGYQYAKKRIDARKRYHLPVDMNLLPQPGPGAGYVGYLAETNQRTFVDFESLKMHTLVAGSTGGGKSFAAQVLVEEALKKNVAVVVFDPTAQWSGFLRKNTNEALLKLYSTFRLNPNTDPMAFKGNIRRVDNYLEVIELKEYLKPGEITIFDCHKMTFEQIDMFVANTVSQVFMAELEESRDLKLLMVYDEVHRLLPKFGGSGAGFMQVERACREFRKWGIGVLLISQVLSDFIGQIKANINTEIQMRTRDEEDLKRLSLKYGDDLLHAVVKAEVGTGMVQNSKYNKGRPWLVSFRPVLHAVERLTEKELRDYDVYNTQLEDLADSLKQLETGFKIDILDMRIELDLAYDKLKEGKFDVVQIYCEELKAKVDKQWEKLKKKPTKRVKKLLDKKQMDKFLELAKRQHYEAASAEASAAAKQQSTGAAQTVQFSTPTVDDVTTAGITKSAKESASSTASKSRPSKAAATVTKTSASKSKETAAASSAKATQATAAASQSSTSATNSSAKDKLAKLRATLGKK